MNANISFDELRLQVTDPTRHDDHIKFKITLRDEARGLVIHSVWRRFNEFAECFKALKAKNTQPPLPDLPPKKTFGKFDAKFIEERRYALERYMRHIKESKFLVRCVEFRNLIGYAELEQRLLEQTRVKKKARDTHADPILVDPSAHPGYPVTVCEEADLTSLQRYLRSSGYSIVRPCQRLSASPTKSRFIVKLDETGEQYVMSVATRRGTGMEISTEKQRKRFVSFITGINAPGKAGKSGESSVSPFIQKAVSADFDLHTQRSFVVREIAKHGSLRDQCFNKVDWAERWDVKHKKKFSALKSSDIAYYGKQLLIAVKCLEDGGVPCPQLTLGNVLLTSKSVLQITDWEDLPLGLTRLPTLHLPGDLSDRTSPYLLMVGVLLFEMAAGEVPVHLRRSMMGCQGDIFQVDTPTEPEDEDSDTRIAFPIDFAAIKLPSGLRAVLETIFDPAEHVTVEEALELPFFAAAKFKDPLKGITVDASRVRAKSKDLEAIAEVLDNWRALLTREQEGAEEEEPQRSPRREKKEKKGKKGASGAASPAGAPSPPPPPPGGPPGAPP
eukprot:Rhum_TRINITY_DN5119_c0_g1::Rhum_TRINITY_DN5119_c0_g1_i1::g.16617::m.16617/K17543/PXK; PX domain-containing protein kinase-like protein